MTKRITTENSGTKRAEKIQRGEEEVFMMQKGFTLFTALVAVMVVFLGVLITQSMTRGERASVEIVSNVEEEAKMLDFTSLRKAEAIQEFNFGLRYAFEKWFTKDDPEPPNGIPDGIPDNYFTITSDFVKADSSREEQWNQIKEEFVLQNFGDVKKCVLANPLDTSTTILEEKPDCNSRQFVEFTAREIKNALPTEKDTTNPEYISQIEDFDEIVFRRILLTVFAQSATQNDFLTVSDCDGDYLNGCEGGGFYINLDFGELSEDRKTGILPEVYEALPQIIVKKADTCDKDGVCSKVLKQPIFPRSVLRVFVPTRVFKALAGAHTLIRSQPQEKLIFDDSSLFKQRVKEIKLGVCDTETKGVFLTKKPDRGRDKRECTLVDFHSCMPRNSFVSPQRATEFSGAACIGDKLELRPMNRLENVPLAELSGETYNPNEYESMRVAINNYVGGKLLDELFGNNTIINSVLSRNNDEDFEVVENNEGFLWEPFAQSEEFASRKVQSANGDTDSNSTCVKVSKIDFEFVFQENNSTYRINQNKPTRFAIRVIDNYNPSFGFEEGEFNLAKEDDPPFCFTTITKSCNANNPEFFGECTP